MDPGNREETSVIRRLPKGWGDLDHMRNTLKDGLYYLRNENVSMKVFLLNMRKATDFIRSGQGYTSFNLLRILNFFYKNHWPHLTSSSKCRGSIKFWFFGNANTGRHCLLLQFHLSY